MTKRQLEVKGSSAEDSKANKRSTTNDGKQWRYTNLTNIQLNLKENSAHDTNLKNIQIELKKNSAQDTNVKNNRLEIKENTAQDPNLAIN